MANPNAEFNADINLTGWNRSVQEMERDARDIDSFMEDIVSAIGDVERAANNVDVDIKPTVDDSEIKQADDVINDVRDDLARLDGETASPNIEPEGETETRNQLEDIKGKLDQIATFQTLSFAWNFLTNLDEIVTQLENIPGLGSLLELERAGASFAAQTGQDADAVEGLITELYTGEGAIIATRDELAQMAATTYQATQNFEGLEDNIRAANNVSTAFGADFNEVVRTAQTLVDQGLAADFQEATDIIAQGFQSGANQGGDYLETLSQFSSLYAQLGLTAEQANSFIVSGLDNGTFSAERATNALIELNGSLSEAGENGAMFTDDVSAALEATGALDEALAFRAGEATGAEVFAAISEGLAGITDEGERAAATAALFGSAFEEIGTEAATGINLDEDLGALEGRAEESADIIRDTLSQTLAEFSQEIDQAFVDILDAANVDEWINEARGKLQTFLDELRGGRGIGEALEIALEIPGLADTLLQIQVVLQDVGIGLLQGIQALLQVTGHADIASGMQETIAGLGEGQLGFAASVAEESDDIAAAVASATSRGLTRAEIGATLEEQLQQAIATGNLEAAQAILGAAEGGELFGLSTSITDYEGQIATLATGLREEFDNAIRSGDMASAGLLADELGTDLRTELARAVEEQDFGLAAILAQQLGGSTGVELQSVVAEALAAGLSEEQIQEILDNAQGVADGTTTMSDEVVTAGDDVTIALEDASLSFEEMEQVVTERSTVAGQSYSAFASVVMNESANAEGAIQRLIDKWGDLQAVSGGGVPAPPSGGNSPTPNAAGGVDSGWFTAGERGTELLHSGREMSILNNQTTETLLSGLASLVGGGGVTNSSHTTNNFYINTTNNGAAAAAAGGNRISDMVRGYQ